MRKNITLIFAMPFGDGAHRAIHTEDVLGIASLQVSFALVENVSKALSQVLLKNMTH
jgi:hypothetical protein